MRDYEKPILIIFAGLTGTGKSTLARSLAEKVKIPVISSDMIRKELAGIPYTEHKYEEFESGIYKREFTDRTYAEILKRAGDILISGSSVIIDASFRKKYYRKLASDMASGFMIKLFVIETICNREDIKKRLNSRIKNKEIISDGRWEIYNRQKEDFDELDEIDKNYHIIVDTGEPVDVCIEKILRRFEKG